MIQYPVPSVADLEKRVLMVLFRFDPLMRSCYLQFLLNFRPEKESIDPAEAANWISAISNLYLYFGYREAAFSVLLQASDQVTLLFPDASIEWKELAVDFVLNS